MGRRAVTTGLTAIVFAKRPVPGAVKTRMAPALDAAACARLAQAMLACTVRRLRRRLPVVLALTGDGPDPDLDVPVFEQGAGDLGDRLEHAWAVRPGPLAFFGMDTPDLPLAYVDELIGVVAAGAAAVGPTEDGGYWCLAAPKPRPTLVRAIDWGSERVYHQTCARAADAEIELRPLPNWPDVDDADDLLRLHRRLAAAPPDDDFDDLRAVLTTLGPAFIPDASR